LAAQALQTVFEVALHAAEATEPAAQVEQAVQLAAPAAEKELAGQLAHERAPAAA